MMKKKKIGIPDRDQLKRELKREREKVRRRRMACNTAGVLIVAVAAVLVSTMFVPVLQIEGSSMEPALYSGEFVVSVKSKDLSRGDVVAFYHNNKILIKRIVALEGESVRIDADGNIYVDEVPLKEPYLEEGRLAFGKCSIDFPCEVPKESVFVLGDNREVSIDSRNADLGCISKEQIISKVAFRVWPFGAFGLVY